MEKTKNKERKLSFNKVLISERIVTKNIKKLWEKSHSSFVINNWYNDAANYCEEIANKYQVDYAITCGIISALSPLKEWEHNKMLLEQNIKLLKNRKRPRGHTFGQISKVKAIYNLSGNDYTLEHIDNILGGKKTIDFFRCIYYKGDYDYPVIDRHMIFILTGTKMENSLKPYQYIYLQKCLIKFSKKVKVKPSLVQATLWVKYKRIKNE